MTDPPSIPGAQHHYAELPEFRVHYAEAGDPSAQPLLLLPGWPQHHGQWARVIELLDDRYRIIAPDLRGFGWSGTPGHGYDGETFAADQVALLNALEIEKALVVGHDWGGWTTILLCLDHGERIERAVACNTPHPWVPAKPRQLADAWRSWYAAVNATPGVGPRLMPRIARTILTHGNARNPFSEAEIAGYVAQFREPQRARAGTALYRYYFRSVREGLQGRWNSAPLEVPTLLLFGERDLYISADVVSDPDGRVPERMRVELVPDSGHFIVNEKPELVVERAISHFAADPVAT